RLNLSIIFIVCFNFMSYVANGLPLAVLPGFVLKDLGFGTVLAGIVIGTQYVSTLLSRPLAGVLADRFGAKWAVIVGLTGLALCGVLTTVAIVMHASPWLSVSILIGARIMQALASALISTPCCTSAFLLYLGHRVIRQCAYRTSDVLERHCRLWRYRRRRAFGSTDQRSIQPGQHRAVHCFAGPARAAPGGS